MYTATQTEDEAERTGVVADTYRTVARTGTWRRVASNPAAPPRPRSGRPVFRTPGPSIASRDDPRGHDQPVHRDTGRLDHRDGPTSGRRRYHLRLLRLDPHLRRSQPPRAESSRAGQGRRRRTDDRRHTGDLRLPARSRGYRRGSTDRPGGERDPARPSGLRSAVAVALSCTRRWTRSARCSARSRWPVSWLSPETTTPHRARRGPARRGRDRAAGVAARQGPRPGRV